jgi:CDGSH-type Zn-finger protein
MSEPTIAKRGPYPVEVEAGKTYYWCSCGRSASQPLCDGSHKGTGFSPVPYQAEKTGKVYFCGCKRSGSGTTCDGSHSRLP